uniref:Uncharacterized protein n=1 Tax=Anguilla anguilla TaxID=7936 RepID=A0A0E9Q482_ANGAN
MVACSHVNLSYFVHLGSVCSCCTCIALILRFLFYSKHQRNQKWPQSSHCW